MKNEIIFIDDNKDSLESLFSYINETLDLKITLFENPEEGIAYIHGKKNLVAVLIDLNMPKIDGKFVAEKIKEIDSKTPLIFLTVVEPEATFLKKCYEKGIVDYILKPRGKDEHYIVTQKIKIFDDLCSAKKELEEEIIYRERISTNFDQLNRTYIHLINQTLSAIIVIDKNDNIIDKNEFYGKHFPFPQASIKKNIDQKFHNEYDAMIEEMSISKQVVEKSFKLKDSDRWINLTGLNIYNSKFAFLVKDVTKKMENFINGKEDLLKKVQSIQEHLNKSKNSI